MSAFKTTALDVSPLTDTISAADLRAFRHSARAAGVPRFDAAMPGPRTVLTAVLVTVVGVPFVIIPLWVLLIDGPSVATVLVALFGCLMGFGMVLILGRVRPPRWGSRLWRERFTISRFAERNGARYTAAQSSWSSPGMIFGRGDRPRAYDIVTFDHRRQWTVGNFCYQKSLPRQGAEQHRWGYVEVMLPRHFPHIVLDSLANNGLRGRQLENPYVGQGAVSLEGNFSQHFRLTCPPGYERDALYLLTPDLMAVLIDEGAEFDIEIVDNVLYLYRPRTFELADPAQWRQIERIVETIGSGTRRRTVNYRDERVGDARADVIASGGSRLSRPDILIAGIVLSVLFVAVTVIGLVFTG